MFTVETLENIDNQRERGETVTIPHPRELLKHAVAGSTSTVSPPSDLN